MADNPATESAPPTTNDEAAAMVSRLLEPEAPTDDSEKPTPEANQPEPEGEPEAPQEAQPESEAEPEEPEVETSSGDEEQEPESVELPDTIDGFANELGVDPQDLANHLKVSVTVNGEKREVTLAEAIAGQQRDSDYRQKTMELAEQRKSFEAQTQKLNESWQQKIQSLDAALEMASKMVMGPSPEEMAYLRENDFSQYMQVKDRMDEQQKAVNALQQERQKVQWEQAQQAEQDRLNYRKEQQQLLSQKVPEVNDPESLRSFERGAEETLKSYGYTAEEISAAFAMFDHRNILILRDAMKYRQMEAGKPKLQKKLKALPKVAKPQASQPKGKEDSLTASKDRLRKLRSGGSKQQQTAAAADYVKELLG